MDTQQFEVIRPKCADLDVHKKSVVAAVCTSDPVTLMAAYKTKVFNTANSDIVVLRDWLIAQDCHDVCMESTGKYWIPIFNILEPHMHVILTHYLRCSSFQRLALICLSLNLTGSCVPGLDLPLRITRVPTRKNPPGVPWHFFVV